jgi:hypothetical protein
MVTAALLSMLLGACGGDAPQLAALREDPLADLFATAAGQYLTEASRAETGEGTALGKPVRARLTVVYSVEGDPQEALDAAIDVASNSGWDVNEPVDTLSGVTVDAAKDEEEGVTRAALTLATESGSAPSGVDVPALIVVLTAP